MNVSDLVGTYGVAMVLGGNPNTSPPRGTTLNGTLVFDGQGEVDSGTTFTVTNVDGTTQTIEVVEPAAYLFVNGNRLVIQSVLVDQPFEFLDLEGFVNRRNSVAVGQFTTSALPGFRHRFFMVQ